MRYAYVRDGIVRKVIDQDKLGNYGAQVRTRALPCSDSVRPMWLYDVGTGAFSPPPLAEIKDERKATIKAEGRARMAAALPYDDFIAAVWAALPANVKSELQPIVDAGQTAVQAVNAATTPEEVEAINPAWPG